MKRREFITLLGGTAAWPFAVAAQQPPKIARLGYLAPASIPHLLDALRSGLRDLGYVEGQNLMIEYRFALGQSKTYDELAAELVQLAPTVIVVVGTPPALAAKRATTAIPIVMLPVADPLRLGLVASLGRPGGNITGASLYGAQLGRKRMEIFKDAVAGIRRIAVLANAENPFNRSNWDDIQATGPALGLEFRLFSVAGIGELATVFSSMTRDGMDAVTVLSDAQFNSARRQIIGLAEKHRLPTMYEAREFAEDGGLISYGPDISDVTRRGATFIVKILNGAKPADLPVEEPARYELLVNLKTAKTIGVTIPPTLLARANEVIE